MTSTSLFIVLIEIAYKWSREHLKCSFIRCIITTRQYFNLNVKITLNNLCLYYFNDDNAINQSYICHWFKMGSYKKNNNCFVFKLVCGIVVSGYDE